MTITSLRKSTTKANKSEVKTQIKTLQDNNKVNYQKLNILQPHLFWTVDFSLAVFIFLKYKKVNPLWVILGSGFVGFCIFYFIH
ncbi:hypothetical protein [Spiroplasma endosymbiont of Glossina fuscipes fuscipes]|uniref:hypothetical protein n=1 Tax=Spiroplasma endosymbiont of Glossina fuscipes fuscipes TaxID=2004463 RepID=UPI003C772AFF